MFIIEDRLCFLMSFKQEESESWLTGCSTGTKDIHKHTFGSFWTALLLCSEKITWPERDVYSLRFSGVVYLWAPLLCGANPAPLAKEEVMTGEAARLCGSGNTSDTLCASQKARTCLVACTVSISTHLSSSLSALLMMIIITAHQRSVAQ